MNTRKNKPKVAIVIPTFNRASYVTKAIDLSLEQTYPCEIIVCDHGSSDNTPDVIKNYSDKVKYIRRETDLGPHFCWLEGILNTDAEFVHIQYDDDWIDKTFIEKTLRLMQDDVGMVFSNATVIDLDQIDSVDMNNLPRVFSYPFNHKKVTSFWTKKCLATGSYNNKILEKKVLKNGLMISPGACLFRKQDIVDALYQGALPIKYENEYHGVGPDLYMTLITLLRYKKFGYIDEILAFFGSHPGSITVNASESEDKNKKFTIAYDEVRKYYKMLKITKTIRDISNAIFSKSK